jgi:hypothetical protein
VSGLFDLTGRTAVVTGAKRGIGFANAEALAEAGADIIGVSATLEATGSAIGVVVAGHRRSFTELAVDFADREPFAHVSVRRDGTPRISSLRNPLACVIVLSVVFAGMLTAIVLSLLGVLPLWHLAIYLPLIVLIGVYLVINSVRLHWVRSYTRRHGIKPVLAGSLGAS